MLRICKTCKQEREYTYDPYKVNRKETGFYGNNCWDCHIKQQSAFRQTIEGRLMQADRVAKKLAKELGWSKPQR
jgi:hypothetical protein